MNIDKHTKTEKDKKGEYILGRRGEKIYIDIKNHDLLEIPEVPDGENGVVYNVLTVGVHHKSDVPTVCIKESSGPVVYRLPQEYRAWAFDTVSLAHSGLKVVPGRIEFGKHKANGKYYAEII